MVTWNLLYWKLSNELISVDEFCEQNTSNQRKTKLEEIKHIVRIKTDAHLWNAIFRQAFIFFFYYLLNDCVVIINE